MPIDFQPPFWLSNPHAQTVWGRLVRPRRLVSLRRESLATPDGDELLLDHLDASGGPSMSKLHFILMHGLEGSSNSVYIQGVLSIIARHGWSGTAINFRSCGRDLQRAGRTLPNRRPRFYHSGETGDFGHVVETLAARAPHSTLVAFGASLGGNVLLKWLGEHPGQTTITAAATVSVPYDLGSGARHMDATASGRFYVNHFLNTLKRKVAAVAQHFPDVAGRLDMDAIMRARTFRAFDDSATAPLHGFAGADDYYKRSSSLQYLPRITTPTLCISSEDDPFLPPEALERARKAAGQSGAIEFVTTRHGGHVGFVAGRTPWRPAFWAEERAVEFLEEHAGEAAS